MADPVRVGVVHRHVHAHVEAAAPFVQLLGIEQIGRAASAVDQEETTVFRAVCLDGQQRAAQWCEAHAARHHDDVLPARLFNRPRSPIRSANADRVPGLQATDGFADRADRARRVHEHIRLRGVAGDRHRHFAMAEHRQHVELPRQEAEIRGTLCRDQLKAHDVRRLAPHAAHREQLRQHRVRPAHRPFLAGVDLAYMSSSCTRAVSRRSLMMCANRLRIS